MAKALTAKAVEAAKGEATRREVPDGALPGLYLVVQPSGAKSWAVRYRTLAGAPRKMTLGRFPVLSLADAREAARAALGAATEGRDPAEERREAEEAAKAAAEADPERDLVRAAVRDFLARHAAKNRSAAEARRIFEREVLPKWGDRRLDALTRRDVIELVEGVADRAPVMANRVLAAVRTFLNWAVARDMIPVSPAAGVKPPTAERSRDRVLNDDEIRWFWRASARLGPPFGPMFRLLIVTGQRLGEVGEMTEAEIAGDLWTIPAARAKNDKRHEVPLSALALAELARRPRIASAEGWVFTTNGRTPASGHSRAKARLDALMAEEAAKDGLDPPAPWRLHDLRRTAASGMARAGAHLPVIERALNHVSGSFGGIVGVYQRHSYEEEKRAALDAWAGLLERIATGAAAEVVPLRGAR